METIKFLKRDIRLGIIRRSYIFLIVIIYSFVMVQQCSSAINAIKESSLMWSDGTVMDYFLFAVRGMAYYRFDPVKSFQLPILWFIFQMGISYFIAYYPEKDFRENGINVLVAGRKRSSWWLSKVLWCIISVLAYYLAAFISCAVFALIKGAGLSFDVTYDYMQVQFGYNSNFVSQRDFFIISVVIPIVVTIGICLVQLLLSFIVSPVTSFAMTCMVYILSAYYTVWFLPGSFTMWLRSSYYDEKGLNPLSGLIIAAFMITAACLIGKNYFEKKDII